MHGMKIIKSNCMSYFITMQCIHILYTIQYFLCTSCGTNCVTVTGRIQDHGGRERRTVVGWSEAEDSDSSCTPAQPINPTTGRGQHALSLVLLYLCLRL